MLAAVVMCIWQIMCWSSKENKPLSDQSKIAQCSSSFRLHAARFFLVACPLVEFRCILRISAMSEQADVLFKLIVIGDTGTGKSCLLHRFVEGK